MGCVGSKPHLLLSSSLHDHNNQPEVSAANSPQKSHILFNAKTTDAAVVGGESATATATAVEKATTSLKLAEALEIARKNFYNDKTYALYLADEASGLDGGYVFKQVGGDTITTSATRASPPAPAIAAANTRDVDALVQQLDQHIEQCVTYPTGTALLNESGAVTSCCSEQQLHAAKIQPVPATASPAPLLARVEAITMG